MSRVKKSRSMKGKLGKTGTKEMLKEQKKARKAASPSKFDAKKAKQRKDQAHRKLERLGLLPEKESEQPKVRPKRFTFTPKVEDSVSAKVEQAKSEDSIKNDLLNALTEHN
ncbi:hypothetical protein [Marinomonas fungiae]|uniref:Uncharacterized protein n=1 Tax=Marinomonas fungiae TaxID=1137284 RepID=A0A0K6IKC2_9GAMM|nr:hypothetical protein [Marinomonas fungiae]CUB03560.1 hypothetical protein Ga0061065_103411 [Marinomonas fungiae]